MALNTIINDFIENKISIPKYIDMLSHLDISKNELNLYINNFNSTNNMDERMNAILILWFVKHQDLSFKGDNIYIKYLKNITSEISNINPQIIFINNTSMITYIDDFYFIINHNSSEAKVLLPKEIQYKTLYCYNCNDDMELEETIIIPEFSFYALKVE